MQSNNVHSAEKQFSNAILVYKNKSLEKKYNL